MARRNRSGWGVYGVTFALAILLHIGAAYALPAYVPLLSARTPTMVAFEVEAPEPEPEPEPEPLPEVEEPEAEPEPEPEVRPRPRMPAPEPVAAPEPAPEPEPVDEPPPAEEVPVSFDNIVLTNDGEGAGWATQQGSGVDRAGPVGPPGQATGRRRRGRLDGTPGGTGTTPGPRVARASDLSRRPAPPANMDAILRRNYPARAERQGVEGVARLRLRVLPNGRIRVLRAVSESVEGYGFSQACRRTVTAERWPQVSLDQQGEPVAFDITYTCRFTVR